jgi:hypothetical protein
MKELGSRNAEVGIKKTQLLAKAPRRKGINLGHGFTQMNKDKKVFFALRAGLKSKPKPEQSLSANAGG